MGTQSGERLLSRATNTDKQCVTTSAGDYSGDFTGVLHGIFEENQVHSGICIIVVSEGLLQFICQGFLTREPVILLIVKRYDKVSEDQWIRVNILVELCEVGSWEGFFGYISCKELELLEMLWADKTITIDTFTFVSPQLDHVVGLLDSFWGSLKHSLERV